MPAEPPVTLPAPVLDQAAPPLSKWQREYRAFQRLLPGLLGSYRGQYVAIHNEQVVDSDLDDIALIQRVQACFGYVPIHVERVTLETPPPARIPHYREYRPGKPV
jgi:hypothetical protein